MITMTIRDSGISKHANGELDNKQHQREIDDLANEIHRVRVATTLKRSTDASFVHVGVKVHLVKDLDDHSADDLRDDPTDEEDRNRSSKLRYERCYFGPRVLNTF